MSRRILFYPLSYVLEFGRGRKFDLAIANGEKLPEKTYRFLESIGVAIVDIEVAKNNKYNSILLQPYHDFQDHLKFLGCFNFEKISYFSDALRNGMYSLPNLDKRTIEFIYFGFELIEETFLENLDSSQIEIPRIIVSFESIRKIWVGLGQSMELDISTDRLKPDDLLVVMRHWGHTDLYPFRDGKKLEDYLWLEMQTWPKSRRVIIKRHPWLNSDQGVYESLRVRLDEAWGSTLHFWEDLFPVPDNFPELGSPEYVLWASKQNLGTVFAFDGSLNNLFSYLYPMTSIRYPELMKYCNFFKYRATSNLVLEQVTWQIQLASELAQQPESNKIAIRTSGISYEKVISKLSFLYQQRKNA